MESNTRERRDRRLLSLILRIVAWVVFAAFMLVVGILIATVNVLTPERITPLSQEIANKVLNADVTVGRVEFSLRRSMPFINVDITHVAVLSRDIRRLPPEVRDTLPEWSDTLISVGSMHGGLNVLKLMAGIIDLKDLELNAPKLNILVVNDSLNNFSVMPPDTAAVDTSRITVPDIRLNRFSLVDPQPINYADMTQRVYLTARIRNADLTNQAPDGDFIPAYKMDFESNISSPMLEILGESTMPVALNGVVEWKHNQPYELSLTDFHWGVSIFNGTLSTRLNFDDQLRVESCAFSVDGLSVGEMLSMIPDSLAREYYIPKDLHTDAAVTLKGDLLRAYVIGSESLPYAQLHFSVPPCRLHWQQLDLERLSIDAMMDAHGGWLNDVVLNIDEVTIVGDGAHLNIKGRLTELLDDPLFDGDVDGTFDLRKLPQDISRPIAASLRGNVTVNTSARVRPSMFSRAGFHRLCLTGDIGVDGFYYLADDTLMMFYVNETKMHFGTNERFSKGEGHSVDSLLTAKLSVDTAQMLVSGFDMKVGRLSLGVGAQNKDTSRDTTSIIPMGGRLKVGTFSFFTLTDSAGLKIRNIDGMLSMRRFREDAHLPLFLLDLGLGRVSAGNNHTRFVVNDGRLNCHLGRLPDQALSKSRREVRHIADSLHRRHPDLSVDSVYIMALEIRKRNRRPGHHRVHPEMTTQDQEIISWGTSHFLTQLLLDWEVDGSLKARTARLFTPSFPVRNLVNNLNINFTNDSINLTNVAYKAGNSDFLISGNVTNLKKAFTSPRYRSPLRINFNIVSELIDVNELTSAFFSGAANDRRDVKLSGDSDESLEMHIEQDLLEHSDSVAPVLIPVNIDAELKVRANHVAYSEFLLNDFGGTVLMYDGALNLHDLHAASKVGNIDITALYSASSPQDIDFGFGMKLNDFNIRNFLTLVPAVDSVMPMLRNLSGIVNANLALTTKIDEHMDLDLPSMRAAIKLEGDSITFIDPTTYRKVAKWLLFKDKETNMINHISAEMIVEDGQMRLFPFIFDFDRYKIGVQGSNDFDKNFNYHIAVLKSPIPFKFGINIKGNYDKLKIRLGRAKFNENSAELRTEIVDTTRINLINQLQNVFKRGVSNSKFATVDISKKPLAVDINLDTDTLSAADSLIFREQGLIP